MGVIPGPWRQYDVQTSMFASEDSCQWNRTSNVDALILNSGTVATQRPNRRLQLTAAFHRF